MKLSLAQKLYFLMAPAALVSLIVGLIAWHSLRIGTDEIERANLLSRQALLSELYAVQMSTAMRGYLLDPTDESQSAKKTKADEDNTAVIAKMKQGTSDPKMLETLNELGEYDEKTLNPAENKVIDLVKAGKLPEAQALFNSEYTPLRNKYDKLADSMAVQAEGLAKAEVAKIDSDMKMAANWITLSLALGTIVLMSLIAFLATAIGRSLSGLVANLQTVGGEFISATHSLVQAGEQVSNGTTEAASSLEETVASIEELSSIVKLNADHAKTAAELSVSSSLSAQQGEAEIQSLIDSMSEIAKSSKKIEEIINVIEDIAFQTNLLALNAAVEAARAGEQGKGFAVVADAVRNLAQRSSSAAKDITGLIHDSVSKTESGSLIADRSSVVLKEIVTSIKKISELNGEISSASNEQATGITQISQAMNELDRATQGNASAASVVAQTSEAVSSQSDILNGLVKGLSQFLKGGVVKTTAITPAKMAEDKAQVIPFKAKAKNENILPLEAPRARSLPKAAGKAVGKSKIRNLKDF